MTHNPVLPYRLTLKTKPVNEPVDLDETKDYLRVTSDDEDGVILTIIKAVREITEIITDRKLNSQTWLMFLDHWPSNRRDMFGHRHDIGDRGGIHVGIINDAIHTSGKHNAIDLPYSPLTAVNSIRTFDEANVATVFDATNYHVFTYTDEAPELGRIVIKDGSTAPINTRSGDGVEIDFTVGYDCIPAAMKVMMLEEIMFRYENRGECPAEKLASHAGREYMKSFKIMKLY